MIDADLLDFRHSIKKGAGILAAPPPPVVTPAIFNALTSY